MRAFSVVAVSVFTFSSALVASESLDRARQLTNSGDSLGAKTVLAQAAQRNPKDITVLSEYAEFLDRYGDPAARGAYETLLTALGESGDAAKRAGVARRLVTLDLLAGDNVTASKHLEAYHAAGGDGLGLQQSGAAPDPTHTVTIPGPLRCPGVLRFIGVWPSAWAAVWRTS